MDDKVLSKVKKLAHLGFVLLRTNNLTGFGKILDEYWKLKKKMNGKVTDTDIDKMYKKAKKHGATGGKIVGAGGGGFLLLFVPSDKKESVRQGMKDYREFNFDFEEGGSKVILNT